MGLELALRGIPHQAQHPVKVRYKGVLLGDDLRLDFLVENQLVVELKAVEKVLPVHEAQLITYLRLTGMKTGLLLNFNVKAMRDGIIRRVL